MSKFQEVFPGMNIDKDESNIKPSSVPIGRSWTTEEKENYYKNMRNNYPNWKNDTLKLLYERNILSLNQHNVYRNYLEDKLMTGFKNGNTPEEFVLNNSRINDEYR